MKSAIGLWDPIRIEQAISNLVSNAIKYGAGKHIIISVGIDSLNAKITVEDHGIGMSSEILSKIFNRFERAATIKTYAGLGLGLFITKEIINEHGGKIVAESKLEEGSIFTIELPI